MGRIDVFRNIAIKLEYLKLYIFLNYLYYFRLLDTKNSVQTNEPYQTI